MPAGIRRKSEWRTLMARLVLILAAGLTLLAGATAPAGAHSHVTATEPAAGQTLEVAPAQIRFVTDGPVDSATVRVVDGCGRAVPARLHVGDAEVVAELPGGRNGQWRAEWVVSGPDGRPHAGEVRFAVTSSRCATAAVISDAVGLRAEAGLDDDARLPLAALAVLLVVPLVVLLAFSVYLGRRAPAIGTGTGTR